MINDKKIVLNDNIPKMFSCAMRGRYDDLNIIHQHLEINSDKYINCLTGVQKDSLIIEVQNK